MTKQEIRLLLRGLHSACPEKESEAIFTKVESLPAFISSRTVLVYWSMPSEVGTLEFIRKWTGSKRIFLPRVCGDRLEICEYSPDRVVEGYRGIMEPSEEASCAYPSDMDIAIVPGLGFDRKCHRLGRGGGFYDRLLPSLRCRCMAVGFSFRWLDELPLDPWDAALK